MCGKNGRQRGTEVDDVAFSAFRDCEKRRGRTNATRRFWRQFSKERFFDTWTPIERTLFVRTQRNLLFSPPSPSLIVITHASAHVHHSLHYQTLVPLVPLAPQTTRPGRSRVVLERATRPELLQKRTTRLAEKQRSSSSHVLVLLAVRVEVGAREQTRALRPGVQDQNARALQKQKTTRPAAAFSQRRVRGARADVFENDRVGKRGGFLSGLEIVQEKRRARLSGTSHRPRPRMRLRSFFFSFFFRFRFRLRVEKRECPLVARGVAVVAFFCH